MHIGFCKLVDLIVLLAGGTFILLEQRVKLNKEFWVLL